MLRRLVRAFFLIVLPPSLIAGAFVVTARMSERLQARTIADIVAETIARRKDEANQIPGAPLPDQQTIRVLLLGLDARVAGASPHCDAIHLFSIDTEKWTVDVTSVPRGTYAYIPKERLDWERLDREAARKKLSEGWGKPDPAAVIDPTAPPAASPPPVPLTDALADEIIDQAFISQESYLANACAFMGLEYGIDKIEKVLGVKKDYLVTVGFSQTVGILRLLGLPGAEALQWLRHRQSYALGDPQRSHNQAVFMKDLVLGHADRFANPLSVPFARIAYSFARTDMGFDVAYALLQALIASDLAAHPERITLTMRPAYPAAEYHFDPNEPLKGLTAFYANVAKRLPRDDYAGATLAQVQSALVATIEERLASDERVDDLLDKAIWLQVEDGGERERLHFALIERTARSLAQEGRTDEAVDLVAGFVLEKDTLGLEGPARDGRALLSDLLAPGTE